MGIRWIEKYLFFPNILQKLIGICLFPLTILYCIITTYKRVTAKPKYYGLPIISVGNLLVGGTGKTPITIALALENKKNNVAIVLRGYGRTSKGLYIISNNGEILEDVATSGDEAMLLAQKLPNATIIVSVDRVKGIQKAKELNCKVVFLDDGYSKHNIEKFDILVRPKEDPRNIFCLPSGGYRDTPMMYSFANSVLKDGDNFTREITFKKNGIEIDINSLPKDLVLLTAISKADRLLEYLPNNIETIIYKDHHNFTQNNIDELKSKYANYSIITTAKDLVKLEKFNLNELYLMDLSITIDNDIINKVNDYIKTAHK